MASKTVEQVCFSGAHCTVAEQVNGTQYVSQENNCSNQSKYAILKFGHLYSSKFAAWRVFQKRWFSLYCVCQEK